MPIYSEETVAQLRTDYETAWTYYLAQQHLAKVLLAAGHNDAWLLALRTARASYAAYEAASAASLDYMARKSAATEASTAAFVARCEQRLAALAGLQRAAA